jgi:8-amino-3,8-dideoxy-alpha-D-manno-octulosonate transaminase
MSPRTWAQDRPHSKVVLLVHERRPGRRQAIMDIARRRGLRVLEDCAQCNGATFQGRPVGTFGEIGIFSLQINKSITAGEGGVLICNDDHLYKRCFGIHDLGYARDNVGILMDTSCDEQYHLWGCGARMSELTGAVALAQISKLDRINNTMRDKKWKIRRELEKIPGISFRRIPDPDGDTGAFLIHWFQSPELCRKFVEALKAEGLRGEGYAKPCIAMENWGLHWYFNNKAWSTAEPALGVALGLPQNDSPRLLYGKGSLPVCDDYAGRRRLRVPSSLATRTLPTSSRLPQGGRPLPVAWRRR